MRLVFGRDEGILSEIFGGDDTGGFCRDDADGFGMADRARRAGEWCGTTPRRGSTAGRPGGVSFSRQVIDREFRI
jgi:hypothetical protein